jgi:ParB-like chromosome segregation protein Spo0J
MEKRLIYGRLFFSHERKFKMPKKTNPERTVLPLRQLKPSPIQAEIVLPTSAEEDAEFRDDIGKGQRDAIVVMPPRNKAGWPAYSILDGHRRMKALLDLGRTSAPVIIRHDLADADADTVKGEFCRINPARRQMHPVELARYLRGQFEAEKRHRGGRLYASDELELRERFGRRMGLSGRNAQRYLNIATAPIEIGMAVKNRTLKLVEADRIARLPSEELKAAPAKLRQTTDRAAVTAMMSGTAAKRQGEQAGDGAAHFVAFANALRSHLPKVAVGLDRVEPMYVDAFRPVLRRAAELLVRLLQSENKE